MGIFRQFPYSNFHDMNMDTVLRIMREMQDEWTATKAEWASYKDFIDNYFATLDVSKEVLAAIRVMAADGSLNTIIDPVIASETADWLAEHITVTKGATVIDDTLSIAGAAADAKATGDRFAATDLDIAAINDEILNISGAAIPVEIELGSINTNTGNNSNITDGTYMRTDFIAVKPSKQYSFKAHNRNQYARVAIHAIYYDASKVFSNTVFLGYCDIDGDLSVNVTTDASAGYVRYRIGGTNLDPSQVDISLNLYDYGGVASYKGVIETAGLDLNNFKTPGVWMLNDFNNYEPDNYPTHAAGKIIVLSNNNPLTSTTTFQLVITYRSGIFYRASDANNTWTAWQKLAEVQDTLYSFGNITTPDLDLNTGDFIHAGTWTVNEPDLYAPKHCPTTNKCRIISFASHTNNQIYTYQIVIDQNNVWSRFASSSTVWTQWKHEIALHEDISFECAFTGSTAFVNSYDIARDTGDTGRVSRMYALYDAVTDPAVSVTKELLGKDASNTFNIYNYKVSRGGGTKPVVLLIIGEHGDELNSAMVGYYAYKEIVTGVLKKYLTFVDFWVIPLINPYGYEHGLRNNSNDVNLNRDFPAEWEYSTAAHNRTGNYSLSQPETNLIYDLLVENKDQILFICNKHDTGSIATKIDTDQPDKVAYLASWCKSDNVVNNGVTLFENTQVRTTDSWIVSECDKDLSNTNLIVTRALKTPGSLDLFANSIGIHGSLLEVCGSAYYSTDTEQHYTGTHRNDLARLGLDFMVNYLAQAIEKNAKILNDDTLYGNVLYYTRELVDEQYVLTEQYWNGTELVNA